VTSSALTAFAVYTRQRAQPYIGFSNGGSPPDGRSWLQPIFNSRQNVKRIFRSAGKEDFCGIAVRHRELSALPAYALPLRTPGTSARILSMSLWLRRACATTSSPVTERVFTVLQGNDANTPARCIWRKSHGSSRPNVNCQSPQTLLPVSPMEPAAEFEETITLLARVPV